MTEVKHTFTLSGRAFCFGQWAFTWIFAMLLFGLATGDFSATGPVRAYATLVAVAGAVDLVRARAGLAFRQRYIEVDQQGVRLHYSGVLRSECEWDRGQVRLVRLNADADVHLDTETRQLAPYPMRSNAALIFQQAKVLPLSATPRSSSLWIRQPSAPLLRRDAPVRRLLLRIHPKDLQRWEQSNLSGWHDDADVVGGSDRP